MNNYHAIYPVSLMLWCLALALALTGGSRELSQSREMTWPDFMELVGRSQPACDLFFGLSHFIGAFYKSFDCHWWKSHWIHSNSTYIRSSYGKTQIPFCCCLCTARGRHLLLSFLGANTGLQHHIRSSYGETTTEKYLTFLSIVGVYEYSVLPFAFCLYSQIHSNSTYDHRTEKQ